MLNRIIDVRLDNIDDDANLAILIRITVSVVNNFLESLQHR